MALTIPTVLREYPIICLSVPRHFAEAMRRAGFRVLGDLEGWSLEKVADASGQGDGRRLELTAAVREVLGLSARQLAKISRQRQNGQTSVPALPAQMIARLLAARSLDAEVSALLQGLGDRNAAMIAELWSYKRGHRPTLEQVALKHGITRERVRQILAKREKLLSRSGLKLPIGTQVLQVLNDAGGALTTPALLAQATERGIEADRVSVAALPSLAKLGLVEEVFWSRDYQLWLTAKGVEAWLGSGELGELTKKLRKQVRKQLAATGAVPVKRLEAVSPFGLQHATWLVLRRQVRILLIGDLAIPVPCRESTLTRTVAKLLCINPDLSLQEIYAGLRRAHRLRPPPLPVVEAVLANYECFKVIKERVSSTVPLNPRVVLSPAELTAVGAFEEAGGLMLWTEAVDRLTGAGYSLATASLLLSGPLFTRQAVAIYSLRGRPVDQSLLREKKRIWRQVRGTDVVEAAWESVDKLVARYRLTRFMMQGILPQPAQLKSVRVNWEARFPDGRRSEVKVKRGLMWPIGRWLGRAGAVVGDIVVATFFLAEGRVEFDHVPSTAADPGGAQ